MRSKWIEKETLGVRTSVFTKENFRTAVKQSTLEACSSTVRTIRKF